jgi:para-aminobenzoate synthetase component 1
MFPRRQSLPYPEDSAALFEAVRQLPWPVFLDSAYPMVEQGRYDIISAAPYETLITRGETTEIRTADGLIRSKADPFSLLRERLGPILEESEPPFAGGAIGYFSYDLARRIERLPELAERGDELPELAVGLYDRVLVVDHLQRTAWLTGQGRDPATARNWASWIERFRRPVRGKQRSFGLCSPIRASLSLRDYRRCFERIQSYIREGDCYQVNFAQRFQASMKGDPWTAYRRLRRINPAPYSAYLELPFGQVLSSSPERFLQVRQRMVRTSPIKGTTPRVKDDPEADRRQIARLAASPKDRAENLMIVDLLRNDLGKVCETGSVEAPALFEIQSFARVHHMVSTVTGRLASGEDAPSLLRACFPGGSITGAPKLRAMQIIEELERARRGVYCGAIGYLGFDGAMDTNIAIRTLVNRQGEISFWAGGGIVADSSVEAEYQETLDKASAIFDTLNGAQG